MLSDVLYVGFCYCKNLISKLKTKSDVDDNFPGETLMEITTNDTPWFTDFANYLVGDVIPKGTTYQQKNKFFSDLKNYFWEDPYLFKVCSDAGNLVASELVLDHHLLDRNECYPAEVSKVEEKCSMKEIPCMPYYLHRYGVWKHRGYVVLGIGQTRFLVKSWREDAVSLLLDTAYCFLNTFNAHDQSVTLESLIQNVQKEAKNQHSLTNELKKQKSLLQKELEMFKERLKTLEKQPLKSLNYKEAYEELEREICVDKDKIDNLIKEKDKIQDEFFQLENATLRIRHETVLSQKVFKERENKYLEEIVDLGEKLNSHDRIVYKMGQSIHMLGKKPNKVYCPFLKAGLGYQNPECLKKAIKA
ncbi:hypothetical protein Tco_0614575 [Tanacetum coccineum]